MSFQLRQTTAVTTPGKAHPLAPVTGLHFVSPQCVTVRHAFRQDHETTFHSGPSRPAGFSSGGSPQYHLRGSLSIARAAVDASEGARNQIDVVDEEDVMELEIKIDGMMCEGCTSRVEEALKRASGVRKVVVSLEKSMASVEVTAPSPLEAYQMLPDLVQSVRNLGFEAEPHIDGL